MYSLLILWGSLSSTYRTSVSNLQGPSLPELELFHLEVREAQQKRQHCCVNPKIMGKPTNFIHFNRVFYYKPSVLGYPYFWKHPSGILLGFVFVSKLGLESNEFPYKCQNLMRKNTKFLRGHLHYEVGG